MELPLLFSNSIIRGQWNKTPYRVIRKLGEGGVGAVYQVVGLKDGITYALKLSKDNISLNREYELLSELREIHIVTRVYEIDDLVMGGRTYYFIILEYIPGRNLNSYRRRKKISVLDALEIGMTLLKFMSQLHEKGYILGDTKLDNIMVNKEGKLTKIIDLGGAVKIGGTIKEFTPAYDRASWRQGNRTSEVSYDLFSAVMVLTQLILGIELNPRKQDLKNIKEKLKNKAMDENLREAIIKAMDAGYGDAKDFANILLKLYNRERIRYEIKRKKKRDYRINLFFWSSLSLLITTIFIILFK